MQLLCLIIIIIISVLSTFYGLVGSRFVRSGVFDNVTVMVKNVKYHNKTVPATLIFIDFDDTLSKYLTADKPSEIVVIHDQFVPKLERNSIADLPKLQNLTLTRSGVREIRRGAFRNLPNLRLLNLSHNAIEEIHQGIFNDLSLRDLHLDHNQISRIGYRAFGHLHLRNLFLNDNKISRWDKEWFIGSSILRLDMGHNLIEDLPSNSFLLMTRPADGRASLIFSGNRLKKVENDAFKGFEELGSIFLDGNSIESLGAGVFNGVERVNVVNLNNNSLTEVKTEVFGKTEVKILMLEDNKLRCLSTDIFKMEELDIDGNPISCFCVNTWLEWRNHHSNPSIYHITNLEEDCI